MGEILISAIHQGAGPIAVLCSDEIHIGNGVASAPLDEGPDRAVLQFHNGAFVGGFGGAYLVPGAVSSPDQIDMRPIVGRECQFSPPGHQTGPRPQNQPGRPRFLQIQQFRRRPAGAAITGNCHTNKTGGPGLIGRIRKEQVGNIFPGLVIHIEPIQNIIPCFSPVQRADFSVFQTVAIGFPAVTAEQKVSRFCKRSRRITEGIGGTGIADGVACREQIRQQVQFLPVGNDHRVHQSGGIRVPYISVIPQIAGISIPPVHPVFRPGDHQIDTAAILFQIPADIGRRHQLATMPHQTRNPVVDADLRIKGLTGYYAISRFSTELCHTLTSQYF